MPTFKQGNVVKVPFPYTSRPTHQFRPALVVSTDNGDSVFELLRVVMITSAENRGWPGDIILAQLDGTGAARTFPGADRKDRDYRSRRRYATR